MLGLLGWAAVPAQAADQIYWSNDFSPGYISFANLDGTAGGMLATGTAPMSDPIGIAIDAATGTVYWANYNASISFVKLDGSGGGQLNTGGANVSNPDGLAIDPALGKVYWTNISSSTISYANLDGSGGGNLNTTGATLSDAYGVVVDPATGRIYWTNRDANTISYANLDGSGGGGNLNITGTMPNRPLGLAIDAATGKIYWANCDANTISYANLDGSGGGGTLNTTGATKDCPDGLAIDPAAGRIYWGNDGGSSGPVSYANLNGSGGGDLTTTAPEHYPDRLSLLETPAAAGAPAINGGSSVGSKLSCSRGSWAPDLLESFLYRAPQTYQYAWTLNGKPIAGASASTLQARSPGAYVCRVTATNHAGSATQRSRSHVVSTRRAPSCTITPKSAKVLLTAAKTGHKKTKRKPGTLQFSVRCDQSASVALSGTVAESGKTFKIAAVHASAVAHRTLVLTVKLPKAALAALKAGRPESVTVRLTATNANGKGTASATIKRLKAQR